MKIMYESFHYLAPQHPNLTNFLFLQFLGEFSFLFSLLCDHLNCPSLLLFLSPFPLKLPLYNPSRLFCFLIALLFPYPLLIFPFFFMIMIILLICFHFCLFYPCTNSRESSPTQLSKQA